MLPEYLDIKDVDKRLRNTTIRLNRIPYVVTISSCEGHLYAGVDGSIPWRLNEGFITLETDGSDEARKFTEWLKRLCKRYDFVSFAEYPEAVTEEEMNERSANRFSVYGFKFPLGKKEYSITTQSLKHDKSSVIDLKRKVNEFWKNLEIELAAYE